MRAPFKFFRWRNRNNGWKWFFISVKINKNRVYIINCGSIEYSTKACISGYLNDRPNKRKFIKNIYTCEKIIVFPYKLVEEIEED
jgi:hypothetical protein